MLSACSLPCMAFVQRVHKKKKRTHLTTFYNPTKFRSSSSSRNVISMTMFPMATSWSLLLLLFPPTATSVQIESVPSKSGQIKTDSSINLLRLHRSRPRWSIRHRIEEKPISTPSFDSISCGRPKTFRAIFRFFFVFFLCLCCFYRDSFFFPVLHYRFHRKSRAPDREKKKPPLFFSFEEFQKTEENLSVLCLRVHI